MTLFKHEMRVNKWQYIIWSLAVASMLGISLLIYPEMKSQMNELTDMFSQMGAFTEAFGMDKLNFGEFMGYFATECGNTIGLGGGIFAALVGVTALYKEESNGTAEFLLAHPISRSRIVLEKLSAVIAQMLIFVSASALVSISAAAAIVETYEPKIMLLIFLAQLILQTEIALICFAVSSLVRRGGIGIGIGLSALFYFMNILSNITESLEFLKFITPYGYADNARIVSEGNIDAVKLLIGAAIAMICVIFTVYRYNKKEIL